MLELALTALASWMIASSSSDSGFSVFCLRNSCLVLASVFLVETTVRLRLACLGEVPCALAVVALQAISLEGALSGLVPLVAADEAGDLLIVLVTYLICLRRVGS